MSSSTATPRVCVGLAWDDGGVDCDLVAFVLGDDGRVPKDSGFVFFNNLQTPGGSVILRQPQHRSAGARHRAQLFVDLQEIGSQVNRVRIGFATVHAGSNLTPVRNLRVEVLDLDDGTILVAEPLAGIVHTTCLVIGDLVRAPGGQDWTVDLRWESRTDGLLGLGRSLGVDLA